MRTYLKHITASLCTLALITHTVGQTSSVRVVDNKGTVNKLGVFWSPVTAGAADIYNTDLGHVGIGTKTPLTPLHVSGSVLFQLEQASNSTATYTPLSTYSGTVVTQTVTDCAATLPTVTDAKPGRLFTLANAGASTYNLTCGGITITPGYAATFVWNGLSWSLPAAKAAVPLSDLLAAVNTNTIDNKDFAQTWNWSTATTQNPLTVASTSLTSGNLFSLSTTNAGHTGNALLVSSAATAPSGGIVRLNFTGAHTGSGLQLDDVTTTGTAATVNANTLTTGTALSVNANALTTGSGVSVTSSSTGINSTNGLLYVANTGGTGAGTVGRIQSNSTAGSGLTVLANGNVGVGTNAPAATWHNAGSTIQGMVSYSNSLSGITYASGASVDKYSGIILTQTATTGYITFPSPTNTTVGRLFTLANAGTSTFPIVVGSYTIPVGYSGTFVWNGTSWSIPAAVASNVPFSGLTAAKVLNTLDNTNYTQTWNWSTAAGQNPLTIKANALTTGTALSVNANALTTGSGISVTSSSTGVNSTNGLLYVANTGTGITGTVGRIQSNSTAGSGLTVLANGNVGIGTIAPNANALLDMTATDKGMLPPRVALDSTTSFAPLSAHVEGMLVYNTDTVGKFPTNVIPGYYYNTGKKWLPLGGTGWTITGNAGTTPAINFMGTTDDKDVVFKRNNTMAGLLNLSLVNTSWGVNAFNATATGNSNSAFGSRALNKSTTGSNNAALGYQALQANTTGTNNTAAGYQALYTNTIGTDNTAMGYYALKSNTATGITAVGSGVLQANTTGTNNAAVGYQALYENVIGTDNAAVGYNALKSNTVTGNTSVGSTALQANTTGTNNAAIGYQTLYSNTTGSNNAAVGYQALYTNTFTTDNTAVGTSALKSNITSFYTASGITAVGSGALQSDGEGSRSTAVGYQTLCNNTSKGGLYAENTALGNNALKCLPYDPPSNGFSRGETAVGSGALSSNRTSCYSSAFGYAAMSLNDGWSGVALGASALSSNTTGNASNAIGAGALASNTIANSLVAVGSNALSNYAGPNVVSFVGIGYSADQLKTTGANSTAIGSGSETGANLNYIQLGNTSIISIGGQVGWTARSDKRVKRNIQENVPGLDFILKLKPITYTFNLEAQDNITGARVDTSAVGRKSRLQAEAVMHTGFAAQDVEKVLNTLGYDFDGLVKPQNFTDLYSLSYGNFTVPLVKAVQEQQVTIQAQQKQIEAQQIVILAQQKQRQQRQQQINELMNRLDKLSSREAPL